LSQSQIFEQEIVARTEELRKKDDENDQYLKY